MSENEKKPAVSRGWNGSGGTSRTDRPAAAQGAKKGSQGTKHGLVAGLLVVLVGVGVWWFVGGPGASKDERASKRTAQSVEKTKKIAESKVAPEKAPAEKAVEAPKEPEIPLSEQIVKESYTINTNGRGKIIERYRTADGKSHMVIGQVQPQFEAASDQLLAMMAGGRNDGLGTLPPMPGGVSNKDFKEALKKEIVINPDDTPEVVASKERLKEIRQNMLAMINDGANFDDVIKEEQKLAEENEKTRLECQKELDRIVAEGDMEGAKKYQLQMSVALQQMGIAELRMPMTAEEKADLMERRKIAREEAAARRAAKAAEKAQQQNK